MSQKIAAYKAKELHQIGGRFYEIRRSARRSVIRLVVGAKGPVRVVVHPRTPLRAIYQYVHEKETWIREQLQFFETRQASRPQRQLRHGECLPFLGIERRLQLVQTPLRKLFASLTDETLLIHLPQEHWQEISFAEKNLLPAVRELYKRQAVKLISERVQFWSVQMGLFPSKVRFREQSTRWGSCSSKKVISFNWRLIVFDPRWIDYVVVHELSHLRHMNHSSHFWSLVAQHIPDCEALDKAMNQAEGATDFLSVTNDLDLR